MGLRTVLGLRRPREKNRSLSESQVSRPRLQPLASLPDPQSWFVGKEFTSDWLTHKIVPWFSALEPMVDQPVKVLDVGSFEGRSAVAFLSYLPHSHVTCIDTFCLEEVDVSTDEGSVVEQRFDRNLSSYAGRVTKIKDRAANAVDRLRVDGATFDVIYLDAGKGRDWIFALTALSWPLLRTNGILIWDDLKWGRNKPSKERPGEAIRLYCSAFANCLDIMHDDWQMIARKTRDWPSMA